MLREHAAIWHSVNLLMGQLCGPGRPEVDITLCETLTRQLTEHNLKEELVLYPQADVVLSSRQAERLRGWAESRLLPEGWTCPCRPR